MDINDVLKHKAIINEFYIDRRAAGVVDSFLMKLTVDGKVYSIHFNDVFKVDMKMNFGIVAGDVVNYVVKGCIQEKDKDFFEKWNPVLGQKIISDLISYEIHLLPAGSTIQIIAKKNAIETRVWS